MNKNEGMHSPCFVSLSPGLSLSVSRLPSAFLAVIFFLAQIAQGDESRPDVQYLEPEAAAGQSAAVVVGPVGLVHTGQVHAQSPDALGGNAAEQIAGALESLDAALESAGSDLGRVVKLNAYVADSDVAAQVAQALAVRYSGEAKPAVSYVTTRLAEPQALVAFDAVAVTDRNPAGRVARFDGLEGSESGQARAAILPAGGRVYIAGQAEPGDSAPANLAEATRKTLASLKRTLEFLKLDLDDVVQLKAFVTPISDADTVRREMRVFFGEAMQPPLVLVEWQSTLPIEIELVAAAPGQITNATIEYLAPPGLEPSPIFARVAVITTPRTIYVSGLFGPENTDSQTQLRAIFERLKKLLAAASSDLNHMAKATYYVADDDASAMLNKLRPQYYDPKRPPAASKAMVRGVGPSGRTVTLDMIAVPR